MKHNRFLQSEEYKEQIKANEQLSVQALEPVVAGAESDIGKEDAQVNTMLKMAEQFE